MVEIKIKEICRELIFLFVLSYEYNLSFNKVMKLYNISPKFFWSYLSTLSPMVRMGTRKAQQVMKSAEKIIYFTGEVDSEMSENLVPACEEALSFYYKAIEMIEELELINPKVLRRDRKNIKDKYRGIKEQAITFFRNEKGTTYKPEPNDITDKMVEFLLKDLKDFVEIINESIQVKDKVNPDVFEEVERRVGVLEEILSKRPELTPQENNILSLLSLHLSDCFTDGEGCLHVTQLRELPISLISTVNKTLLRKDYTTIVDNLDIINYIMVGELKFFKTSRINYFLEKFYGDEDMKNIENTPLKSISILMDSCNEMVI